jgi:hypothetical protein
MPATTAITTEQNTAADALLAALKASANLAEHTCEGSEGHLRDVDVNDARVDLYYLRTYPDSPILALNAGGFVTIEDWLRDNSARLARWHEGK